MKFGSFHSGGHHTKWLAPRSNVIGMLLFGAFLYPCLVLFFSECSLGNDSGQYFAYAKNIWDTGVYGMVPGQPDGHREPLYSLLLAGFIGAARLWRVRAPEELAAWMVFLQSLCCYLACASVLGIRGVSLGRRLGLFALLLLSPTVITMNGMIYSEALAYSLVALFIVSFFTETTEHSSWRLLLAFGIGAALVLTKIHFQYLPFLLLPVAGMMLIGAKRGGGVSGLFRRGAWFLGCFSLGILVSVQAWELRNARGFASRGTEYRKLLNVLGKTMRSDRIDFSAEAAPGFAAALGTNFCERAYGRERCRLFDFQTSDKLANRFIQDLTSGNSDASEVEKQVKAKILAYWRESPFRQLMGSFLEAVRISFFEFTDLGRGSANRWVGKFPSLWHFLGSLGLLLACVWGATRWKLLNASFRLSGAVCLLMIGYHYFIYINVTNVARFSLVILPLLYCLAFFPFMHASRVSFEERR